MSSLSTHETGRNTSHPAVKRILRELKEIQECDNPDIAASALEDNIFEWLFVIRGAWGTEFEGGLYHGRILMPAEYPFKPPSFVMLTPSGRFETKTKICLSISSFHPESWQPSWSVQSALVALIAFMQTPGQGAIGSLDCSPDIRRQMALESRTCIPQVPHSPEKQAVINQLHAVMLEKESASRDAGAPSSTTSSSSSCCCVMRNSTRSSTCVEEEEKKEEKKEKPPARMRPMVILMMLAAMVVWILLRKITSSRGKRKLHGDFSNLVDASIEL